MSVGEHDRRTALEALYALTDRIPATANAEREYDVVLAAIEHRDALAAELASVREERDRLREALQEAWERIAAGDSGGAAEIIETALAGAEAAPDDTKIESLNHRPDAARQAEALRAYELAVQEALRVAPAHWQRYRDPLELGSAIQAARRIGRAALAAAAGDTSEERSGT